MWSLWLAAFLALVGLSLSMTSRTEALVAQNVLDKTQAGLCADAALARGSLELFRPEGPAWPLDGSLIPWQRGGCRAWIRIFNEGGKIDLNAAPEELLQGVLQKAGADEEKSLRLARAIEDWRDPDSIPLPQGAEREAYESMGAVFLPRNGPFLSVAEAALVLGMDDALFSRLEPALTVYSGASGVDLNAAPQEVLELLPESTPELVQEILEKRKEAFLEGRLPSMAIFGPLSRHHFASSDIAFSISVAVQEGRAREGKTLVLRPEPSESAPFRALALRPGLPPWAQAVLGEERR